MEMALQSTGNDLNQMLGDFLRRRTTSAKDLARLIDCDPRTADGFRAGRHWPQAKHWRMIVRQYRRDVIDAVFGPDIDETGARLALEKRALERQLHELNARLQADAEPVHGHPQRRAADAPGEPLGPENLQLPFEETR